MNEKELIGKIHSSMYHQLQVRGYAAPVDVCGIWKLSAMPT